MKSDAVLARLLTLHPKLIDLSLDRIERLLGRLGHPEAALPPVVHVAGTNGKGSLLAFLRAMLEAAGRRVHVYTSPHLVRFAERIVVAGGEIDDDTLTALLEECEKVNDGVPITFFEITTAAAFLAFARAPADIALVETGLGGRFDATNVLAHPALTAITPIGLDHMQYLGDTLGEIAFEKAGILKPGTLCVCAPQDPAAMDVIAARARALGAPFFACPTDWRLAVTSDGAVYADADGEIPLPPPALPGPHQARNAALAVACARRLPEALRPGAEAIRDGIARAVWPARLQRLDGHPFARLLPDGWELWLDGAHNRAAAVAVVEAISDWRDRPLDLVCGMLETKDAAAFFSVLAPVAARTRTVTIPETASAVPAARLAEIARAAGHDAAESSDVESALAGLAAAAGPRRVLIVGSLYLAGAVLSTGRPDL